ncbi:MAG: ankyrin repeat domain-containing protein, partial [Psychrosphaera sp.]|nr:ankyrin repeat domain-containing protein [Psychrosphaera sp.]
TSTYLKTKVITTNNVDEIKPITFTAPFEQTNTHWLKWTPIARLKHKFAWQGLATQVLAIGSKSHDQQSVLLLEIFTIGWRGPFFKVRAIKKVDLEAYLAKFTTDQAADFEPDDVSNRLIRPTGEGSANKESPVIFEYEQGIYLITDNQSLMRLNANDTVENVCKITEQTAPEFIAVKALVSIVNRSIMTQGITHIPMYYGTIGNPYFELKTPFKVALSEPWKLKLKVDGSCIKDTVSCQRKQHVDDILAQFGDIDRWSARELLTLKNHIKDTVFAFTGYYKNHFKYDSNYAKALATHAVYQFLSKILRRDNPANRTPASSKYPNWFGKTNLMLAAHFNDVDTIKRLLADGADVNEVTFHNVEYPYDFTLQRLHRSALSYAAENAALPVIQALVNAGADLDVKDTQGNSLDYYFAKNPRKQVRVLSKSYSSLKNKALTAIKPSFNCLKATTKIEKTICASQGLSLYDWELGTLYKKLMLLENKTHIRQSQRLWLKALAKQCKSKPVDVIENCLKNQFRARVRFFENVLKVGQ